MKEKSAHTVLDCLRFFVVKRILICESLCVKILFYGENGEAETRIYRRNTVLLPDCL